MDFEKRKDEQILFENNIISYIDDLNETKLSLRSKNISKLLATKRRNKLEQTTSSLDFINKELQFQINKFSSSYNKIISYLTSSDDNLRSYILNQLCTYFKYNEPDITEQKMIIEGQFLELLLNLGKYFYKNKNDENLILVIWIFINIQIYKEGNGDYLKCLYNENFLEFYNECFIKLNSEEIMNEIIILLYYSAKINIGADFKILQSKVFESIINYILNEQQDLEFIENVIKLMIVCLNISENDELGEREINLIDKCLFILKNESNINDEKIQKLCYEGLYIMSKIDDKYEFNQKMIKEGIPKLILKIKNKNILLYSLKTLTNILTVTNDDLEKIDLNEIINFYNSILHIYDDDKIEYIILNGIYNIADSKYINIIKSSIIWSREKIQKYFNKNEKIQLMFIKIIKYIVKLGDSNSFVFINDTNILEYLIYLISNTNYNTTLAKKILKLIDIYLNIYKSYGKDNFEYLVILNKFKNWINLFSNVINEKDDELEFIIEKYK